MPRWRRKLDRFLTRVCPKHFRTATDFFASFFFYFRQSRLFFSIRSTVVSSFGRPSLPFVVNGQTVLTLVLRSMDFKEKETLSKMAALARFTRHLNDLKPVQKTKKKNKKKFGITFDSHKRAAGSTC